jgi:Bacterial Ig domain/Carboxypeptidase regulatory-like domain/IPT/TIG domain/Beta-propeller repeat/Bacterial TSP3 repeat
MRRLHKIEAYSRPLIGLLLALAIYTDCLGVRIVYSGAHLGARHSTVDKLTKPEILPASKRTDGRDANTNADPAGRDLKERIAKNYGKLPLSFEINKGQIDPEVKFYSRGAGYDLYLTPMEAVVVLSKPIVSNSGPPNEKSEAVSASQQDPSREVIRLRLSGANASPRVVGVEELLSKSNYFIGNDPRKWRANVSNYARVKYEKVYPGVDMVYYGNQQQLEYDFIVAPRADPSVIKLSFEGMDALHLDENGDLVLSTKDGDLRQHKPVVYQEINGKRTEVLAKYVLQGKQEVGFSLGVYDRSKPLIIDPVLSYASYLGGAGGYDFALGIAVDASGQAVVVGETGSPNFPRRNSLQAFGGQAGIRGDAFITKFNATGTAFIFSTYYGGSSIDVAEDVALDASGNIYVTGWTSAENFPVTAGAFRTTGGSNGNIEVFIAKLNPTGSTIMYSTYVPARDDDFGMGIVVDSAGNACVVGRTNSDNFPTRNALQPNLGGGTCGSSREPCFDAFVTKLNATGTDLIYSTYLGGTAEDRPNWDSSGGIAIDSLGAVYVTGLTRSTDFPTVNPYQATHAPGDSPSGPSFGLNSDVFVTKLDPSGQSIVYSTFIGGPGDDAGQHIVVDSEGHAYLTGRGSGATGFPITPGAHLATGPSFVTKMSPTGDQLVYSTNVAIFSQSIAIDSAGNAYLTGDQNFAGFRPANVSKLDPSGTQLIYSFFFGGTESQFGGDLSSQIGNDIALDSSGNMYIAGDTFSANFPVTAGAPQQIFGGNICGINFCNDGFVVKIADINGHRISGRVTDSGGNSLGFTRMTLSGGLKTTVMTDSSGNYAFTDLMPNRTYTVTPTRDFFTFAPVSQTFTNVTSDQTADFVGTRPNVAISGNVTNANNTGISGVTVTLSGAQSQTTQTDTSGGFTFGGLPSGGTYTVTPSRGADVFDPTSRTFLNIGDNKFASFKLVYSISGQVTDAVGAPAPSVTLTLSGAKSGVTQTDVNGNYSFVNLPANGNYTVTPSKASILTHTFTPPAQTLSGLSANGTANFSFTTSTNVALFPVADAYVQDGTTASTNFGTSTPMLLKTANQSGQRRDVYLKFDVSSVSRNITSAKLRITAALTASGAVNTSAYSVVDTTWLESDPGGINWNNKPVRSATALPGATVAVATTTYANYDLDITGYIAAEKAAGRDVISLALHNPSNSNNHITMHSREATANKPQLLITTSNTDNAAPTVSLATNGVSFVAPANITVSANAVDADGTISRVDFFAGTSLIGTDTTAPYSIAWNSVAAGGYSLTAVATDNSGASSTSSAVNISVNPANSLPQVSLTAPGGGVSFPAGGNISLAATASDVDGSITKVDFFAGALLVGTDTSSPYQVTWTNARAGAHTLTAVATDNSGGTATSNPVNITVVWQAGLSALADAYVRDGTSAATNFGTALELQVQASATAGSNRESYLKFNLTTVSGITNAKLRLYGALSDASGTNVPAAVHSVAITTWVESGNGSLTWNNRPAAGSALATTTITNNVARWYEWDITAYIQAEKAAGRNTVSLVVKNTATSTPYATFNSREGASNQPQLQITTTATRNILFVTGSSTLNTSESAFKTRMENLGFTVTVKAAGSNNNTAVKTTDADGKAAVVISSTVTPNNVAVKFRHVPVPVILWEADLLVYQGMTGAVSGTDFGTTTNQTQVSIVDAAHPLAAGLAGTVSVVSTASSFTWGKPNANAAKIASLTGDSTRSTIFGYETGAAMPGLPAPGLPAPARRVAFFLTDTNGVNLTANGAALFDAAIKWATANRVVPTLATLTPTVGTINTSVTLSGYNFGDTQGTSTVTFNGVAATTASWTSTSITAVVPPGANSGPVLVVVNGLASNAITFIVELPPVDTDGDGLADAWELQYFGNLSQGPTDDPDGDGVNNLQEYQQGRNPTLGAEADSNGGVQLRIYTPLVPISP